MRLAGELLAQGLEQARLADAGLAGEQDHLTLALLGLFPAVEQQGEFLPAADQGREARPAQRLKAALGRALAGHPPSPDRRREAFERYGGPGLRARTARR